MRQAYEDVKAFMAAVGQAFPSRPAEDLVYSDEMVLYRELMREEFEEFIEGESLAEEVDGAIDLIWVTLGWLVAAGVDPVPVWEAVKAANMSKASGPVRADGKREKPPGFRHPDVAGLIEAQRQA